MASSPTEGLKLISWRNIEVNNELFLVKFLDSKDSYELLLMDRKEGDIWYERVCSPAELLNRSREMNPAIEMPVDKLLIQIRELTEQHATAASTGGTIGCSRGSSAEVQLKLNASRPFAGLTFLWQFILSRTSNKVMCEHVTEPLLLMLSERERRQRALCALLRSKDREIEDLKAQAVQLTRKKLETKRFDEELFHKERDSSPGRRELLATDASSVFDARGRSLYTNISEFLLKEGGRDAGGSVPDDSVLNNQLTTGNQSASSATSKAANQSPTKRPTASVESMEVELQRRQELEKRLAEKDEKEAKKKKKKLNL